MNNSYKLILLKDGRNILISNEKTLSNNGDYYLGYPNYDTIFKWEMKGMHEGKQVWINKIIAGIEPLPTLTYTDEVKQLLRDKYGCVRMEDLYKSPNLQNKRLDSKSAESFDDGHFYGFEDGWKAHQSITNKMFSLEDIKKISINFAEHCKSLELLGHHIYDYSELFDDSLNEIGIDSLRQPIQLNVEVKIEPNEIKVTKILE